LFQVGINYYGVHYFHQTLIFITLNLFSDDIISNEMKNVLKGNYVEVLEDDLFLDLYNKFEHLSKSNFSSNIINHLNDFLLLNPLKYVHIYYTIYIL